jgi:hypothetical protein
MLGTTELLAGTKFDSVGADVSTTTVTKGYATPMAINATPRTINTVEPFNFSICLH